MPTTDLMGIEYPSENQDPYWDRFKAMMNQVAHKMYKNLEDPNLVLRGGGEVTLDGDTLTWTENFEIMSMLTGGIITIEADTLTLEDGKIVYVEVSRPVQGVSTKTFQTIDTLTSGDEDKVFVLVRRGSNLYFRNNLVGLKDLRDPAKFTTGSIASGGGSEDGPIDIGFDFASVWMFKVTATGTVNSDIQFFSDVGLTDKVYEALAKDCTAPYEDLSQWFTKNLTDGKLYYKITNNGASASVYNIEFVCLGKVGG